MGKTLLVGDRARRQRRPVLAAAFFLALAIGSAAGALHDSLDHAELRQWLWLFAVLGAGLTVAAIRRGRRASDADTSTIQRARVPGTIAAGLGLLVLALPSTANASFEAAVAGASLVATEHFARLSRRQGR